LLLLLLLLLIQLQLAGSSDALAALSWVQAHLPTGYLTFKSCTAADVPPLGRALNSAQPRQINNSSLYKLEQRLSKAVTIDAAALTRHVAAGGALPAALPAAAVAGRRRGVPWWFGANGLLACEPCPLKVRRCVTGSAVACGLLAAQ
jgi:hypothetical protein